MSPPPLLNHQFFDPRYTTIGIERHMVEAETIADDRLGRFCHPPPSCFIGHDILSAPFKRRLLGLKRSRKLCHQSKNGVAIRWCGFSDGNVHKIASTQCPSRCAQCLSSGRVNWAIWVDGIRAILTGKLFACCSFGRLPGEEIRARGNVAICSSGHGIPSRP
jgi:hypothetical protein